MNKLTILILEDDERLQNELKEFLQNLSFLVYTALRPSDAFKLVLEHKPDIALIDIKLPEYDGLTFLKKVRERGIETEAIIMSGHGDMDTVIEALRAGAYDYLRKPFSTAELHASLMKTERYISLLGKNKSLETLCKKLRNESQKQAVIVGDSPVMKELQIKITQAAGANNSAVLITGESGTGKELIAKNIHMQSSRGSGPFVAINCAAIPKEMFESELFGHEKGAFTDAKANRDGLFRSADKGTLFLDEIGEIPLELQGKLLRAIETQSIRPVGSDKEQPVSVRIISATNADLSRAVQEGRFRNDLFYRIAVLIIQAPPLREHPEDIPTIAEFFHKRFAEEMGHKYAPLAESFLKKLMHYSFPGNVRELKNIIERYCILGEESEAFLPHLPHSLLHEPGSDSIGMETQGTAHANSAPGVPLMLPTLKLDELEQMAIEAALRQAQGVHTRAAEILGISRQALERRLQK